MLSVFRKISYKPSWRLVAPATWARLSLCLGFSVVLHVALLVPDWQNKPSVPVAIGPTLRVSLVEAPSAENPSDSGGSKSVKDPPSQQSSTMPLEQEALGQEGPGQKEPGRKESLIQPVADKTVKLLSSESKPKKSVSATLIPKDQREVEDSLAPPPAKSTSEPPPGAHEEHVAEPLRHDSSEPEVKAQAHPAETLSGPATVFQCVDLICAQRADRTKLPSPLSPKTEVSKGTRTATAGVEETTSQGSAHSRPKADFSDATPRYQSNPLPEYPYLARQRHWEGEVWLLVTVSARGRVEDLEVATSSGYGALDKAALSSVRRWRFSPAEKAGIPVASKVKVPVRFQLQD